MQAGDGERVVTTPTTIESPRRERRAFSGGLLLRVAVTLVLLGALLAMVDLDAMARVLVTASPLGLLAVFALLMAERLAAAYRWYVLLRLAQPGVRYRPVLRITFISNFIGAFLPGGVGIEVLRVYGLARTVSDLPLALSSVLVDRLCGLLSLVLLIGAGVLLSPIPLPLELDLLVATGLLALLAFGLGLLHPWPRARMRRLMIGIPVLAPVRQRLVGIDQRLATYGGRPGALMISLGLAILFQLLRVLTVIVGAMALDIAVDPVLFVVVVPVAVLIALMPISLGGFGPREASYVVLLGLAGVAPEPALVLALVREVLNLATTLPGAVMYARGPRGDGEANLWRSL